MKSLVVIVAVTGLLASAAFAAPKALSSAQMDRVSAGAGILDCFLGSGLGSVTSAPSDGLAIEDNAVAADNALAIQGDENQTGVFADDNDDSAVAVGTNNKALYIDQGGADYALATGDNAQLSFDITKVDYTIDDSDYSANIIGDNNEVCVDNSYVDGYIENDSYGVIAREATVSDSFNYAETDIEVEVEIEDSFNVCTKTLEVCPEQVNAISFIAALGDVCSGINLSLVNATAAVPTAQGDGSANVPIIAGNAIAVSVQNQVNVVCSHIDGNNNFQF